jgi:hypothetical protein
LGPSDNAAFEERNAQKIANLKNFWLRVSHGSKKALAEIGTERLKTQEC